MPFGFGEVLDVAELGGDDRCWDLADDIAQGSLEAARAIEPLAMLWCIPGFLYNEWGHAFKVLHS